MRHAFWDWSKKYGTNIKITGGTFASDVSKYLTEDYAQGPDGVVGPHVFLSGKINFDFMSTCFQFLAVAAILATVKSLLSFII